MKKIQTLLIVLAFGFQGFAQTVWKIDKTHSDIRFTVTHMKISEVDGEFKDFDATVISKSDDFDQSEVEFATKVASINTDNSRRDNHLKSDDFFNASVYPEIKFKGKINKEGEKYYLAGDFTMKNITKQVRFDVQYNGQVKAGQGRKAGFKVTGTIDRFDYGLTWSSAIETGELVVGREVEITCHVELDEIME